VISNSLVCAVATTTVHTITGREKHAAVTIGLDNVSRKCLSEVSGWLHRRLPSSEMPASS